MAKTSSTSQPAAPAQTATTPPPSPQTGNKGLVIGAIVVVAVVIVGLIVWGLYSVFFAISRDDYQAAGRAATNVMTKASSSYSDMTRIASISSYSTETTIKNNVDSAKKSLAAYKEENKQLADLKALRDKDIKQAYDKYQSQYDAYVKFADAYTASAEKALPAIAECEDISSAGVNSVETFKARVQPCADAIKGAKDVSQEDLKKFIEAYQTNIDKVTAQVEKAAAIPATDFSARSQARTEIRKATTELQDAQRDANSTIQKKLKDVSPRDAYNDLRDVINDKIRG